jgi:hypothetical protein
MNDADLEISRQERATSLGLAFLRSILLLNGGGILALLTFLGNASAQTMVTIPLQSIKWAMFCFLVAISTMMLGLLVSYAFTATTPGSKFSEFWNYHIVTLNSILGAVSLSAFIVALSILIVGTSQVPAQ